LTATAGRGGRGLSSVYLFALAPLYLIVMVRIVRPVLGDMITARMADHAMGARGLVLVGVATIASALATELMGLHYIIGAFLIGAIMPIKLREPTLIDCRW
jgi:Kef-type K+ transport system membrane component KefB